jgi:SOS-response transcriptional repressor LexA
LLEVGGEIHVRRYLILKRNRSFKAFNPMFQSVEASSDLQVLGRIVALIERDLASGSGLRMGWAPPSPAP